MRFLFLFLVVFIIGCAGKPTPGLTVTEEAELQVALDEVMKNVEYIVIDDEESFIKDNNLSTIQVVRSNKNQISEDGQVVYTSEDSLDSFDTEELLIRYLTNLSELQEEKNVIAEADDIGKDAYVPRIEKSLQGMTKEEVILLFKRMPNYISEEQRTLGWSYNLLEGTKIFTTYITFDEDYLALGVTDEGLRITMEKF